MEQTRSVHILLVEDSPTDAGLAMEAFKDSKLLNNLAHVEDGTQAISYLRRENQYSDAPRPDLVLLDLNLPTKGGREVLKEIKADPDLKDIPVIVLTTSDDDQDILNSYELHANCYITKPVDFEKFVQIVRHIQDFWFSVVTLPTGRK